MYNNTRPLKEINGEVRQIKSNCYMHQLLIQFNKRLY